MVRVHDLDVLRELEVAGGHLAGALPGERDGRRLPLMQSHGDPLEVEQDVDDVLLDALHRAVLVEHAVDLHLGDGGPAHGRQQDPPQGVPEGMAEAPLERFQRHPRPRRAEFLYADLSRREQFVHRLCHVCVILRSLGLAASRSVPSLCAVARYSRCFLAALSLLSRYFE